MALKSGKHQATEDAVIWRKRSNSIGNLYQEPSLIDYFEVKAGETFNIPETVNGYYYTPEPTGATKRIAD